MVKLSNIEKIRSFNRKYLPTFNLLDSHYLGSKYSIPEIRVIYEIYRHEGCNAAYLSKALHQDKGYLSRIIKKQVKAGYVVQQSSTKDNRSYDLLLTEKGKEKAEEYIQKTNNEIGKTIASLSESDQDELVNLLDQAQTILNKIKE